MCETTRSHIHLRGSTVSVRCLARSADNAAVGRSTVDSRHPPLTHSDASVPASGHSNMPLCALPWLLTLPLLSVLSLLPALSSAQCSFSGPFPSSTYAFNLTFSDLSTATAPPLFATQLLASIDADLQASLVPPPTASTVPDLQCGTLTSPPANTTLTAQLYILGTLSLDTGTTAITALSQLLSDIRTSTFQQSTGYAIDPTQHVPVAQVCSDGLLVAVNASAGCGDEGGGGGLSEGVKVDIVILVLVVASVVFGVVAWRWLQTKQRKDRAEGRL